jgi:hypothetical protein
MIIILMYVVVSAIIMHNLSLKFHLYAEKQIEQTLMKIFQFHDVKMVTLGLLHDPHHLLPRASGLARRSRLRRHPCPRPGHLTPPYRSISFL